MPTPLPFRAVPTPELLAVAREGYGLLPAGQKTDLGGINLNLEMDDPAGARYVLRVYSPWVTADRVRFVQLVRGTLRAAGLPFTETVATGDGETVLEVGGRAVEVERFVPGTRMDEETQLETGMVMLGRVHDELAGLHLSQPHANAEYPNHVASSVAIDWAQGAAAVVSSWSDATNAERDAAIGMVRLAEALAPLEAELDGELPRQLVHGDFWDNNVLFDDEGRITAVLDLDFAGVRPRIDDVALTFYYTTSGMKRDEVDAAHLRRLRRALDAYDSTASPKLSEAERLALPLALARTVLFSARYIVEVKEQATKREILGEITTDIKWSCALVESARAAQDAFV